MENIELKDRITPDVNSVFGHPTISDGGLGPGQRNRTKNNPQRGKTKGVSGGMRQKG